MAEVMDNVVAPEPDHHLPPRRRLSPSTTTSTSPPPPPRSRGRDRDLRERIEDRQSRRTLPPLRRDFKRGRPTSSSPPPPPYRDRRGPPRHSPPPPRRSPPYKRHRRDDLAYNRRGYGPSDRRFYSDYPGGNDREMGSRHGYPDERHGRFMGRAPGGFHGDFDSGRGGGFAGAIITGGSQREGLMSYKQFMQELEDDVLPAEAEHRYQEYKSEYITTLKKAYFDAHKDEEWLKDKYHPTNLVSVIERRNEVARKQAKDFQLDLQSGTLDLGPGVTASSSSKSGHSSNPASDDEEGGRKRLHARGVKQADLVSQAPKAHPLSSEPRRIQIDIEQAQTLMRKLDSEKGIEDNILRRSDKSHGSSSGPVIIIRGLTSVRGLEGIELVDTLLTYLWRIHGVDYYGMSETNEAKGLRHVRMGGENPNGTVNGGEWENKLDSCWQERLKGQDPLETMTAKEKIDAAATEALDPYVRKIKDEKYGWKYGCGAKGCTKLFHASEFVQKHLKLKHPDLLVEFTSKVCEDLYFQNYMNDENAPGGTPVMQQPTSTLKDRLQRRRPGPDNRMTDERDRRERENRPNGAERYDRADQSFDDNDAVGNLDDAMFDAFGAQGISVASFSSDMPPLLMPVPGAGPLGPFVPAPPEVAMQMMREQGGPLPFEGTGQNGRSGPQLGGPTPIIGLPPAFQQDPRRLRSYQDLDAPEDEVTVIDYRSL
ncbi:hypothetical protein Leryth_016413 [Lithospermum erythrorhizon]|nr:hypothetical protein Leryth_016413 [Lithospermum erythrorhizon]